MTRDFESYQRSQENAAFGRWLLDTIADLYGCEHTAESVDRAVYKNSDCGAWCRFDEYGIKVGTIVEGSDAAFSTRVDVTGLGDIENPEEELIARFRDAIADCEAFSGEHFWG